MNQPEGKNPEHRSNNAMLCFWIGVGLHALAYFLGFSAVLSAVLSGGNPAIVVGGMFAAVGVVLMSTAGFVMMVVGSVWMVARVIADQTGDASEKRYRDVER